MAGNIIDVASLKTDLIHVKLPNAVEDLAWLLEHVVECLTL